MKTISFLNNKGGVLKTSLVTNIAGALAKQGNKVLILDTDPQGSALSRFGRNPEDEKNNLLDIFIGSSTIEKSIKYVYMKNLAIIASDFSLSLLDLKIQSDETSYKKVNLKLKEIKKVAIKQEFDYLLIDCAPTFGFLTNEIIDLSDSIVVPSSMEQDSFKGITNVINVLLSKNQLDKLFYIVPTLYKGRTKLHKTLLKEWLLPLAKEHSLKVTNTTINDSIRVATSSLIDKLPITLTNTKIFASKVYFDLVEEMGL